MAMAENNPLKWIAFETMFERIGNTVLTRLDLGHWKVVPQFLL